MTTLVNFECDENCGTDKKKSNDKHWKHIWDARSKENLHI